MFIVNYIYDKKYGRIIKSALRKGCKVYTGNTHSECFIQEQKGVLKDAEQGFMTARGKFVDRKIGLKIAKHYKQINHKHSPKDELMSEDLI